VGVGFHFFSLLLHYLLPIESLLVSIYHKGVVS